MDVAGLDGRSQRLGRLELREEFIGTESSPSLDVFKFEDDSSRRQHANASVGKLMFVAPLFAIPRTRCPEDHGEEDLRTDTLLLGDVLDAASDLAELFAGSDRVGVGAPGRVAGERPGGDDLATFLRDDGEVKGGWRRLSGSV